MFDDSELEFVKAYASDWELRIEVCRQQLRALWTAYCIHKNYECDTRPYDEGIAMLWSLMDERDKKNDDWSDFEDFDIYMGAFLC